MPLLLVHIQCIEETADEYVDIGNTLNNVGCCLSELKRCEESYNYFIAAEELMKQRLDPVHPRLSVIRSNVEKIKCRRKKYANYSYA